MSPKTLREKWMLALLPAILTLLLGWAIFYSPKDGEVLRKHVESQGPLSARQARVALAQAEAAALEKTIAQKRAALTADPGGFDRNHAMQQVSELCAAQGLSLNAAKVDATARLPKALDAASGSMLHNPAATEPQVWRFELSGSYAAMQRLLEGLQRAQPMIVPLCISMDTRKNGHHPQKWVLTLWL